MNHHFNIRTIKHLCRGTDACGELEIMPQNREGISYVARQLPNNRKHAFVRRFNTAVFQGGPIMKQRKNGHFRTFQLLFASSFATINGKVCGGLAIFLLIMFCGHYPAESAGRGEIITGTSSSSSPQSVLYPNAALPGFADYVVIGWNDLGMHCINSGYKEMALLPPFNNLWVQVILRGDPPKVITSGVSLEYSIANNTKVTGKTDFWTYAPQLFGISLPLGVGLTGNGLSGKLKVVGNHFEATGIPVLPYDDKMNWNPFQVANIKLRSTSGRLIKTTQVVLPVSDEINCAKCHAAGMDATANITDTGTVEGNILAAHDYYHGPAGISSRGQSLYDNRPVLCANCHASNALGKPGDPANKSVSEAMHGWHSRFPDAGCYDCHPGALTQCLRTSVGGMGYLGKTPSCPTCHGDIGQVAASISQGRQPWVQEPSCQQCHGTNAATGSSLYRHSTGHGGVNCAACHNSPHAWWPSKMWSDNTQPVKLQKKPYSIDKCTVCHTKTQQGDNPHVTYYTKSQSKIE